MRPNKEAKHGLRVLYGVVDPELDLSTRDAQAGKCTNFDIGRGWQAWRLVIGRG